MSQKQASEDEFGGLRELITEIARAADDGSGDELNAALNSFSRKMFPILQVYVASQLRRRQVGGPDGLIAEAEDILNLLLMKLTRYASHCTAPNDERTWFWLQSVIKGIAEDEAKTPRRRFWLLIERLKGHGYHHESWSAEPKPSEQERNDDRN